MEKIKKFVKELPELRAQDYLVFGRMPKPKKIIVFEKYWAFERAIKILKNLQDLFVCTLGIPSQSCINFFKKFNKDTKILYFGDLDPISIYSYLTLLYLKHFPAPKDKMKLSVKYAGIKLYDYKNFLKNKNAEINLCKTEERLLEYIKSFNPSSLQREILFLSKNKVKIEMESLNLIDFESYFKSKIK